MTILLRLPRSSYDDTDDVLRLLTRARWRISAHGDVAPNARCYSNGYARLFTPQHLATSARFMKDACATSARAPHAQRTQQSVEARPYARREAALERAMRHEDVNAARQCARRARYD